MGLKQYNIDSIISLFKEDDVVIFGVLNWGLGHATRSIPMIEWLQKRCKKVIIASDGAALSFLRAKFPLSDFEALPSYNIHYRYESIIFNILTSSFSILKAVRLENQIIKKITEKYHANVIVSDNRLGFYNKICSNIYVTHQINILHRYRMISLLGTRLHSFFYSKFDHFLIPDFNGPSALCPLLSHTDLKKAIYIGPLTRIKKLNLDKTVDILVILSGPEPQRTMLESALLKELNIWTSYKITFVRGTESKLGAKDDIKKHIEILNVLQGEEIERLLNSSKLLIARSGYSTIMDVSELNISTIWIPTLGQTEQEYLAEINRNKVFQNKLNQNELNKLQKIIISMI